MNRKNRELGDRIKQVAMEAQSWHCRAKYNESVVNVLKSNIQQLMEQGTAQAREGSGESEVDDAVSSSSHQRILSESGNKGPENHPPPRCRACNSKQVSVLMLPCRHLCLCTDCEGFIDVCPVCQVMKTASVHVYMQLRIVSDHLQSSLRSVDEVVKTCSLQELLINDPLVFSYYLFEQ